jgi:predicted double-glycine peptidase
MGTSIIPVALDGYNHFVVFRAVSGNRVLVADPAWGNRTLMLDKFIDAWIDIDGVGRVGFFVYADQVGADTPARNRLQASELDFVMLR